MSNTQSHLIVTEEGIKIFKDDPASAILCEDQVKAITILIEQGVKEEPPIGSIYPVPGIEFEEVHGCEKCGAHYSKTEIECRNGYCEKRTVARLIEHMNELIAEIKRNFTGVEQIKRKPLEHTAEKESPEIDKEEESQEEMLGEILANYREHQYMQKHEESFFNEATFMKAELEKFHLTRKP